MAWKMFLGFAIAAMARMPLPDLGGQGAACLVASTPDRMKMEPLPINPDWIISGQPQARIARHSRSADEWSETAVWDCTAGTFNWHFGWDETVTILEGEVEVTSENGIVRILKAGDIAYFAAGSRAVWQIDTYVRKIAFLRKPLPRGLVVLKSFRSLFAGRASAPI